MTKRVQFRPLNGIILLDKPKGLSSNRALQNIRFLFRAEKAGHTGALDPLATGLLPLCFGEATKFSQFLLDSDKTYQVTAKLGERTTTSDAEGEIVATAEVNVTLADIETQVKQFLGVQQQQPSIYSALKYEGKPLYHYARKGIDVPRPIREIEVYTIDIDAVDLPFITLTLSVSKGTYIRTIIDDLGENLGCGAHVTELRRTRVAGFDESKMFTPEQLAEMSEVERDQHLLAIDSSITHLPKLELTDALTERLRNGQRFVLPEQDSTLYRVYQQSSQVFLGIAEVDAAKVVRSKRLLNTAKPIAN